ncbi:MAG: aldolase/citrate lyase family protein [Opitutales bacterium]
MKTPTLHQKLLSTPLVGPFSKTCDPNMVEALGFGGFDFIILDLEHGPNEIVNLGNLIRAAERGGMFPVVRILDTHQIGRALDLGAAAVRFAPGGHRGVCRYVRAADHSALDKRDYFATAEFSIPVKELLTRYESLCTGAISDVLCGHALLGSGSPRSPPPPAGRTHRGRDRLHSQKRPQRENHR